MSNGPSENSLEATHNKSVNAYKHTKHYSELNEYDDDEHSNFHVLAHVFKFSIQHILLFKMPPFNDPGIPGKI